MAELANHLEDCYETLRAQAQAKPKQLRARLTGSAIPQLARRFAMLNGRRDR